MTIEAPILVGVIGSPIGHSKSPLIHGHWIAQHGLRGYYIPMEIRPENFEPAVRAMPKLGIRGVNVTIPYKETILSLATSISDRAALIGAANTIVFGQDGSIRADNTDGIGFIANIKAEAPDWDARNGPAVVLGAGGASRAIVSALLAEGAPEIRLANRTRHRAEIFRDQFGAKIKVVEWARVNECFDGAALIVNATSLGMEGKPPLRVKLNTAPNYAIVTDIVYTPLNTDLLEQARSYGLRTIDGLGMLLHQAVPSFEYWFDIRPEADQNLRRIILDA